jgi:hypothetical protein
MWFTNSTTSLATSNAYIAFKVKKKSSVIIGDQVQQTASRIFDFNTPIITNTVPTIFIEQDLNTL